MTTDARDRNDVRLVLTGESASAMLRAGEADPTASPLVWRFDAGAQRGPVTFSAGGATGSPLLVPYLHEALAAFRSGGQTVSVADVAAAHRLTFSQSTQQ